MRARAARMPLTIGFGPFSRIATRVRREVQLWRWRRERSQHGAPVTVTRRRPCRAYMFETRRSDPRPGF
jgi:hypothetical protein